MATSKIAELRARLQQAEDAKTGKGNSQVDNALYPHWNIPDASSAVIRFLPDDDVNNSFFWVERQMIKLPFQGVKGDPSQTKRIEVQVPCMEMYNEQCPVLTEIRPWYKDESLKELANAYWKKRSYIFQGFVRSSTLVEENAPTNPIRRFAISPQIFNIIKTSILDPEFEDMPTDFMNGIDFNIKKGKKGEFADYSTSTWSRKNSALTEAEMAAIKQYGLFKLSDFLPKKPSVDEVRIIKEMFEASIDNQPYDAEKWAQYFKPYGVELPGSTGGSKPKQNAVVVDSNKPATAADVLDGDTAPWEGDASAARPVVAATSSGSKANDILAAIRSRQTAR